MKNFCRRYKGYGEITPQLGEQIKKDVFSTPWGHHKLLIDKFLNGTTKGIVLCPPNRSKWVEQECASPFH